MLVILLLLHSYLFCGWITLICYTAGHYLSHFFFSLSILLMFNFYFLRSSFLFHLSMLTLIISNYSDPDSSLTHIVWFKSFKLFVLWAYHVNVCWQQINKFLWSWTIIWKIINRELFVFYPRFNKFLPLFLSCCWPRRNGQNMQWNEHFWR